MNRQINSAVLSLRQLRLRPFILGLITILIPILFLVSLGQFIDNSSNDLIDADILSFSDVAPLSAVLTDDETTDKAEIVEAPDSAWLQTVQNEIRQSEYRISWQENEPVSEATGAYQAPNRSHDFRTFFIPEGIRLRPRTESNVDWQWGLSLVGYGYDGHIRPVATAALSPVENRITYRRGQITEWYINDERGLEQGFTVEAPPHLNVDKQSGNDNLPLILALNLTGNLTPKLQESGTAIDFHTADGARVLRYSDLVVYDANGKSLPATMRLSNCADVLSSATCQVQLAVNDHGAVYPITVDPIATDPDWSESGGQLDADFGYAVAGAGDVNGDGYDDIIIGAPRYDNGETDEGRAFAYYGSASGLATSTSWTAESNQANAEFGHAVAGAGDVDNDGYADVIVGAPSYDNGQTDEGQVFVYHGSSSGLSATADWTAESDQADASFGYDVTTAGDVNNDGYDDIIIGAPYYDNGQSDEGQAYVFYGSASGLNATPAWTAESNQADAEFGHAVAGAGDVNNDGYADVIVGAPWYDNGQTDEGQVFVYHGSSSGLSATADWTADESDQASACFGCDVATAGDVNGDGYDDIIIGAPYYDNGQSDEGKVYAFHGSSSGLNASAAWTAESDTVWAYLGSAVATAGDVNQDGYDDVIVGAYFYKNGEFAEGTARVYHGAAAGLSSAANWYAEGNQASANFGIAVAGAGDVNGDGYDDAIIGAHQYDGQGSAFSYYGSSNGLSAVADWTAEQDQQGAQLGRSVSTAGDVNNDGYDDVIIGAPEFDNGQSNEGRVFVYYGAQTGLSLEADWMAEGDQANARFGKAVANAGDVNDDGYDDVIIGSEHENGQAGEGRATVYHGSAAGLSASADWSAEGNWAGAFFGDAVAGAGDINGDGYDDVIIGAQYYDNGQTDEGKVAVYYGSSNGLETTSGWEIEGNQGAAYLGISVSTAGDVNGDGYADIIVGEYRYDNGQESEGGAFVYHGSASGLTGSTPDWSGESNQASAAYGYSVSSAGDINNDGYDDVIVGAPYFDNGETNEGRVYVYTGSTAGLNLSADWTAEGNQGGAYFGYAVSAAGDVNGDGYDDILVGAPYFDDEQTDEGQAFLYHGSSSGLSATADWTFASGQANARLGKETAVSEAGDVNGDGYGDIIFGASYYVNGQSREGLVFVFHGSGQGVSLPEADFEATPLSGTVPLTVTFTNSSLNAGSFLWHFGDGITSTIASPQHTYTQAGVYTVALSAYGAGGLSDVITKTNYITATAPMSPSLEADFTAVPINGNVPLTVTFNDNSTGNITNYDWDFGDGNQSNASSPVHTYTEDGIYTVSLTVTGTGGAQDTRTRYNYIFVNPVSGAIPNAAPVITITNPVQGSVVGSYSVQVNGQVTDDGTVQSVLVNNIPASIVGNTFSASITVGSGNQTINAVAEDNEGAMGFDSTVVQVDDAGPRIDIDQPPNRQAIYSSTPTLSISYSDFLSDIDTGSLLVQLTDENNVITDVTSYLTVAADSANGTLSTPLINNSSFTLTVTVADTRGNNGSAQSTFYVADGVTPPIEPANAAWASGVVYDSGTCSNEYLTTCQGLAGVQVTAAEIDPETRVITPVVGTVVSGPDGFFAFPFDKTGFFTLHFEKDTFTYSQREVAVVRGRSTATNEIYLTPLDTAVETCGNSGCTYANSSDTIRLDIPAGAIPKGETIDVVATVLEQVEFLPSGDLPPDTWETYAFNLSGDSDIQFMRPITVQMANTRNFDPGTRIPLGYWNPDTLQWEHKGVGTVDETGQWLVMHVTHFSMYDCNAGVTRLTLGNLLASLLDWLRSNGSCTAGTPGCFIDAKSGQLREWIQLPAVSILGESVAPQLGYSTARANPSAVIDIELNLDYDAQFVDIADYLYFELYIEGEKTDTFTFSVAPDENGEVGRFRYFWDGRNALGELLPPGIYEYAVRVRIPYTAEYYWSNISLFGQRRVTPTGVTTEATRSEWLYGTVELNTQVDSALGSGWVLEGHQHLTADEAGRILVTEDDNITEYYNGLVSSLYGRRQYNLPQPPVVGPAASVTISPQPAFGTHVSGTIASNTNWTTVNSPYILDDGNVTVADGVMLTIEPDVQVMIDQDLSLLVNGVISASGTATSPITFTAYTDGFYEDWTTYPITNTELSGRMTVETAATDAWGNTWLGGNAGGYGGSVGITRLGTDLTLDSFTLPLYFSSASTIYGVAIDSAGQKWFVSDHGVAMLPADNDDANWTEYTQSNSELLSDYVYAVAVDANDGLWFGTDSGVNHLTAGGSWTSYTEANSDLASDSIRSIAVGQNGDILVGTSDAGLSVFDGTDWTIYDTSNSDILGNGILDIAEDNAGNIWLAVAGQGISVLQTNSSWENYTTSNSDLVNNFVTSVAVDIRNRKWIGYQNDGVSTLSADNQSWLHEAYPTLASNYVWGIAASPNGDVWLAMDTDAGISRYHEVEYYDGAISGGYWGQVKIGGGANMNDSDGALLRYVTFESGGVGGQSLVHVDSSTITLENVRIGGSGGDGLTIEDSSNVTLNEVISEANEGTGIKIIGGSGGHIFTDVQSWDNKEHGLWLAHNGRITVTNATLAKNLGYAIFTEGTTANITLQNSTMQGNYQSARLAADAVLIDNDWLENDSNRIEWTGGTITGDRTWSNSWDSHNLLGNVTVSDGVTLTIEPGTTILLDPGRSLFVNGILVANGSFEASIYFASSSRASAWQYVQIGGGVDGDSDDSILRYVIAQGGSRGLYVYRSTPTLEYLTLIDNSYGMYVQESSDVTVANSNFARNSLYGLHNASPSQIVTATHNYWGSTNGPNYSGHPSDGQDVSGGVIVDPWRGPVLMDGIQPFTAGRTEIDRSTLVYDETTGNYIRRYYNGYEVYFDALGRHDYSLTPGGRIISFTYNLDNSIATMSIIAPGESTPHWTWTFNYVSGKLDSITDPAGRVTDFTVDENGQLTEVSFPDGSSEAYFYDARNLLTQHVDKNGAVTSYAYDEYGRVLTDTRPIRAVYDPATDTIVAEAEERTFIASEVAYPLINDSPVGDPITPAPAVPTSTVLVDSITFGRGSVSGLTNMWGNWLEFTDATDRTIQYDRNSANYIFRQTYPDGSCDRFAYDYFGNVVSARRMGATDCALSNPVNFQEAVITYEPRFNQIKSITDPLGRTTTYIYDYEEDMGENGNVIRIEYPPIQDESGNWITPTMEYTYNSLGLMETQQNENGALTRYVYTTITDTQLFLPGVTPVPGLLTQVIEDDGGLALTTTYRDFDANGTALTEIAPGGVEMIHYATDEMGRVISETNAAGATTLYDYDAQGNLIQRIADYTPDGVTGANLVTLYTYDADNRLLTEERVGDEIIVRTSHMADINGNPAHSENAMGHETLSLYDDANRLVNAIDPAGQVVTYTHDVNGRVASFTNVDGIINKTFYDDYGRVYRTVRNWEDGIFNPNEPDKDIESLTTYDDVGNTIIVTDTLGRMTRTFYDSLNRVQGTIVNWDGTIFLDDCAGLPVIRDNNICTQYAYDAAGNTTVVTDTLGHMTRTFYDDLNRVTATVANWNPATLSSPTDCVLSPTNESDENVCSLKGYDDRGNLITTTNALNQTSLTVYDTANRFTIQVTNWDGTTIEDETDCQFPPLQPDANICSVTTYDGSGRQISGKDALGNITTYEYDSLGRLITTTRTLDGQPVVSVTAYDALGRRISQTNAANYTTYFLYDNLGRLIASRSPEGVTDSTIYDAMGRDIAITDNLGHITRVAYDDLGRVISTTNAAGDITRYEYDGLGNQVAMIDAEEVRTTYQFDDLNRRVAVIENNTGGGQTSDSNVLTQYVYDALGNQVVITNARGFTNTFTIYDDLNRAIAVEDALGNRAYTQYNALGMTTVMTDANEAVTRYEYDGLNRRIGIVYETDNETVAYSYDALGNRRVMTDSASITNYEYDDLSRLITVTTPFTGTVIYDYDLVGNRSQITYPDGKVVTYTHDGDNRLYQVFDWDEGVTTYEYDEAGNLVRTLLPNGVETTETYDEAGRLIRRTHTSTITGILHADYIYELDGLGNHLAVTETIRAPEGGNLETTNIIYGHDSLYRVTQAAYSGVLSGTYTYEYDAVGNRKQFTTNVTTTQSISYTYDAANRLLESVDLDSSEVTTYEWDDAGRLITTTVGGNVTRLYSYSQDGDLLQANVEGAITTFVYDGNGNRLQMSIESTVTTYTLDYAAGSRVLFEEGGAFSDTKHYLYGRECIGEHVDADDAQNNEWRFYQRDANLLAGSGLVRQTSDENRQVTMAWTYSPTGGVVLGEGGPVTNLACGNGGIYDWSTGLIFKNGRYFDPNTGIWITMGAMVTWQIWPQENRRQRRWRKRYGPQIGLLMLLLLLILVATSLSGCACGPVPTPGAPTVPPTLPPFGTPTPGQPGTPTPGQPSPTPQPPPTDTPQPPTPEPPTPIPPTPTNPPTQTPQMPPPRPTDITLKHDETWTTYEELWYLLHGQNSPYLLPGGQIDDQFLVAVLIKIEIESSLRENTHTVYRAALEAISRRYDIHCGRDGCSLKEQLELMDPMQNWWDRKGRALPILPGECSYCLGEAATAIAGFDDGDGHEANWWGNPLRGSEMHEYIKARFPATQYQPFSLIEDNNKFNVGFRGTPDGANVEQPALNFVVVTRAQQDICYKTSPNCMGFP